MKLLVSSLGIFNKKAVVYNFKEDNFDTMSDDAILALKTEPVHYIHLIDRSGSMYSDLPGLLEDLKRTVDLMDDKDLLSIIYFASHDRCAVLLQGANKNTKNLNLLIDSMRNTLGLTCFSSPLKLTNQVITDLKAICDKFVVTLHTDGCPVTPWSDNEELQKSVEQVKLFSKDVLVFNAIGYGYYYDEAFLRGLVNAAGNGYYYHSEKIDDFSKIFGTTALIAKDYEKNHVNFKAKGEAMYLTLKEVRHEKDGEINLEYMSKYRNQFVAIVDEDVNSVEINGVEYSLDDAGKVAPATMNNILYALSSSYAGQNKFEEALDVMVKLKDKYFIDRLLNVFTKAERADLATELKTAYINNKKRFKEGEAPEGYLPPEDVFNIMDLFRKFDELNVAYVVSDNYERIGMQVTESHSLFVKDDIKLLGYFNDLVYSEEKLNISLRFEIPGTVKLLAKQAKKVGLDPDFKSLIYRMHTFVKDGNIHMKQFKIEVLADKLDEVKKLLTDNGIIILEENGTELSIDISMIPITNRKSAKESNIYTILSLVAKAKEAKAKAKVVKQLLKEAKADSGTETGVYVKYTPEQIEVLKDHGVDSMGRYCGNGLTKASTEGADFYEARCISFGIKGWSTEPTVKKVQETVEAGKKLSGLATFMAEELITSSESNNNFASKDEYIAYLVDRLAELNYISRTSMREVALSKISKIVAGLWWEELDLQNVGKNETIEKDGVTLVVKSEMIKCYFS